MKAIKLILPLVISISIILPVDSIKSFNHRSNKNLVINKEYNEFSHKISYFFK